MHHDGDDLHDEHHGHDELHKDGTPGDDVLTGGPGNHILHGGAGNDTLWGGEGDDDIGGGSGDDLLIGGPGGDLLDGGPGHDIASYIESRAGVHVDLSAAFYDPHAENAPVRGGDATGDQLTGIEELWGSNRGDVLRGNHTANRLFGNGGNDQVYGGGGNDFLRGGMDADSLFGDGGKDELFGDMGVDELMGGAGDDILFGGDGDDTLMGGPGNDMLEGGAGADSHHGDGRVDAMTGDPMMDTGSDTAAYTTSPEAVTVNLGGAGTAEDPIAMGGHATGDSFMGIENLRGSMYDDMLVGDSPHADYMAMDDDDSTDVDESMLYSGANTIYGNMGADKIKGMGGADMLYGGKGDDVLYGGDGMGGADGDDKLYGQIGDDLLKGGLGNDTLTGGAGADKLFGGWVEFPDGPDGDPDPMADEEGMDTADYSGSPEGVHVDLTPADVDENRQTPDAIPMGKGGDAEGDSYHDIQNLTGSAHMDMLKGDMNDNVLMGMGGDDWDDQETTDVVEGGLFGGAGQDELHGGDGNDWLDASGRGETAGDITDNDGVAGDNTANLIMGGKGNDMLIGGAGHDRDEIDLNGPDNSSGLADGDTSDDNATITEGGLFGGAGNDTLNGGDGADVIMGEAGDDTIIYDAADNPTSAVDGITIDDNEFTGVVDSVDGGTGTDTLDASASTTGLTLDLNTTDDAFVNIENVIGSEDAANNLTGDGMANSLTGGEAADTIAGMAGNDMIMAGEGDDVAITGGAGNDTIYGGDGADSLLGGAGADMLVGGEGADTLDGDTGADTFVLGKEPDHTEAAPITDTISDFNSLQGDVIDLTAFNLSNADLEDIIGDATVPGTNTVALDLSEYGGGAVQIVLEGLGDLGIDDFMI